MSNRRNALLALAIALAGAAGLFALSHRPKGAANAPAEAAALPATGGERTAGGRPADRRAARDHARAPTQAGEQGAVTVAVDEVVARVNGLPVRGGDLAPFKSSSDEITMSGERYQLLLDRAVEREVVLQAARSKGITLGDRDKQALLDSLEGAEDQLGGRDAAAFERRERRAKLLLNELAARAGAASPFATQAEIDAYQAEHAAEIGPVPSDPAARSAYDTMVREKIALERQRAHATFVRELLDELLAKATIG